MIDLRNDHDVKVKVEGGILYRKGMVNQVWWDTHPRIGMIRHETWTAYTEEDATDNFNCMKERWNE